MEGYDLAAERSYPTPYAPLDWLSVILLSMAAQRHTPRTKKTFQTEYDYIIVGAGSAGSVLASRLSELPCASVLLLEAGKSPPKSTDIPVAATYFIGSDLDWNFLTTPQEHTAAGLINRSVPLPYGKAVGGSTVFGGMQYVRGHKKVYEGWAAGGAVGWSFGELLPFFNKLEDDRDAQGLENGYHSAGGPVTVSKPRYDSELKTAVFEAAREMGHRIGDVNGPVQDGFFDIQVTQRDGQRCSNSKAYLVPADNRQNLDIVEEAFVKKVTIVDKVATGVVLDFQGEEVQVRARKEVILSAGAIKSPQILMLSGIGPAQQLNEHEIPIVADLPVGLNLQEHVGMLMHFELNDRIESFSDKETNPIRIYNYLVHKSDVLTSTSGVPTFGFFRSGNGSAEIPDLMLVFGEGISTHNKRNFNLAEEYYDALYGSMKDKAFYYCLPIILSPRSRGTITLNSTDPFDPPLIDPRYFEQEQDVEVLLEGARKCREFGSSEALRRIGSRLCPTPMPGCEGLSHDDDDYWRCVSRQVVLSNSQVVGTVKMGDPDDPTAVLDPQLRVKGIGHLRVVDASVNVPTTMLAERAAHLIKETVRCPRVHRSHFGVVRYNPWLGSLVDARAQAFA